MAARFDDGDPPPVTRVHGDLHIAQLLRTPAGVYAIDFEGDPTWPIAERRAPTSPMRDVACLVRSLDHVARSARRDRQILECLLLLSVLRPQSCE